MGVGTLPRRVRRENPDITSPLTKRRARQTLSYFHRYLELRVPRRPRSFAKRVRKWAISKVGHHMSLCGYACSFKNLPRSHPSGAVRRVTTAKSLELLSSSLIMETIARQSSHISTPRHLDISTSQHPDVSTSRHIVTSTSRHLDISASRHLDISTPRHLGTSTSRHLGISTTRHLDTSAPRHLDTSTSRHLNISTPRYFYVSTSRYIDTSISRSPSCSMQSVSKAKSAFCS